MKHKDKQGKTTNAQKQKKNTHANTTKPQMQQRTQTRATTKHLTHGN
jgi:hypothetical protein